MTAAWGEPDTAGEDDGESIPGSHIPLGNGHSMQLNPEQFKQLLHLPEVVAAITERAQEICDTANDMAITRGAHYIVSVQNRSDTTRARARVRPGNFKAMVDDAYHSTLQKASSGFPSDPIPESEGPEPDTEPTAEPEPMEPIDDALEALE